MAERTAFALRRPEFADALARGDRLIGELMQAKGQARRFIAGQTIVSGGERHEFVYRLRKGWVARVRRLPDGRTPTIALFLPGDLFALKSMYLGAHPDAIVAASAVEVSALDHHQMHAASASEPDVMVRVVHQLLEDERMLHNHVVVLGAGTARERLAALLVDLRGRLVLCGEIGPEARTFSTPFTQEDLGDMAGLSTIHVNRVLKDFREADLATVKRGQVRIANLNGLWRTALPLLDPYQKQEPAFGGAEAVAA